MLDPAIGGVLAGAFALLFASAALQKLRSPRRFVAAFRAYEVLPPAAVHLAGLAPVLELTVAAGLLVAASRAGASAAGAALLVCYACAIGVNLARGRRDLACGCGGPDERRPIAAWMVWRNLLLAALLAALSAPWRARPLTSADALTVGAGTAAAALIYMSVDRLLGQVLPRGAALRGSK